MAFEMRSSDTSTGDLRVDNDTVATYCESQIDRVPWALNDIDVVIDSSGVHQNVVQAHQVISSGVKKVVVTHSPDNVDITLILGVNHTSYDPQTHNIISSSICDAVAAAPLLALLGNEYGIDCGHLTTLHPFLSYQNLLDGPSVSWSWPGEIYHHYALGRASTDTLIPKPTSAVDAIGQVLPDIAPKFGCMSFRVPTAVVGAALFNIDLKKTVTVDEINSTIEDASRSDERWSIFGINKEPLVSVDFLGSKKSLVYDQRWTNIIQGNKLYAVCWYDNEWGYSARVLDIAEYVCKQ